MEWTQDKISKRLQEIKTDTLEGGILARGQKEFIAFCEGESISARQAWLAHCYQCMGFYTGLEGERDCKNPVCPGYGFMPYSSSKRISRAAKPITEEHKEKMRRGKAKKKAMDHQQKEMKVKKSTISFDR